MFRSRRLKCVIKMDFYDVNAHVFKYDTLQSYVARPFQQHWTRSDGAEPDDRDKGIFYAGLGNTLFDMHAYHHAGIALHRMFLIDKQSRIYCLDQNDIQLELNGHHPREYARAKGTLFVDGYRDDNLLSHISRDGPS
jgi:hypothetical protein